jgi:Autographiviridae terminase large subunit
MLNGYLYVLACGGLQGGYEEHVLRQLAAIALKFKVNHILIEANFGDGMYTSLFKPVLAKYWNVTCEEVKHSVQKEKRICDSLEPIVQQNRMVLDHNVIEQDFNSLDQYSTETGFNYSLIHQFSRLTREKGALVHDDRLDALSMACMYWVEQMASDADTEQLDHRSRELDKELEKFMDDVLGVVEGTHTPLWTDRMR